MLKNTLTTKTLIQLALTTAIASAKTLSDARILAAAPLESSLAVQYRNVDSAATIQTWPGYRQIYAPVLIKYGRRPTNKCIGRENSYSNQ
jgi:hypothetical protein